jgi:hypothetical protein
VAGSCSRDDRVDLAREGEEEGMMRVLSSGVRRLRLHLPSTKQERLVIRKIVISHTIDLITLLKTDSWTIPTKVC